MAASNDPPSPGSRNSMAGNAYDDEWKQAEDHDWPTQLISSVEEGKCPQDHDDSRLQAEADEAILNGIVSEEPGQSSRQASRQASPGAPIKVLTRPVSSGKDPAAGFSFSKAKPMQQLDFRRPKQAPVIPQPQDSPPPSRDVYTESHCHQSPHLPDTRQAVKNVVNLTAQQLLSPKNHNTSMFNDHFPVPFPNITPAYSQAYQYPTPNTTSGPIQLNFSSTRGPPNEVSLPADDPLPDSSPNKTDGPHLLKIISNHSPALASGHNSAEVMRVVDQPQTNMQNRSRKASRDPLTFASGAPKITKPRRRKTKTGQATEVPPSPLNPKYAYTDDDLLRLLMYRRRQGQQELEYFRTTQSQKEAEIQKLRDLSDNLSDQLQEVQQRETQKSNELSKIKANKPIWESKIKRLNDYVKGLTNDHSRLRENADDLHKQHKDVSVAGKELHNMLEAVQKSAEQERIRSQRLEDDARHRIETLAQTVQCQSIQLRSDENLLMTERERSNRLEDQISRITATHAHLLELFTSDRDNIASKIDNLLHQAQSIVPPSKASESNPNDHIRPMLEQCVGILKTLQDADIVKPADLRTFNNTVDSFVEGIARSVEACKENSNSIEVGQRQLALAVQDQFRALSGNIFSEHALSEQISDLREMKATVRERLQAAENSLAETRQEVLALRLKDQEKSRRVVALESLAAGVQKQPAEAPESLLRIQELESRNRDLQSEIVTLRKEATDLSSQVQQSSRGARETTERLATTQEQVEAAHEEISRLREGKSTSEKQAIVEQEQLRKEYSKAANMQLASVQKEHMNAIQQLKLVKSPAIEKLETMTRQFNIAKAEKENSEKENTQLQASLKAAQNETNAVIGTRKALQLHLKEMEVRMLEKNDKCGELQVKLNEANDQLKAKDIEIIALQEKQATRPRSSRGFQQSSSAQGTQPIRTRHTEIPDSQHASVPQSPSVQSANPRFSRHFTSPPPIEDDSQLTEKPRFVSLDDIMLDDPFARYAQEESQTIGGENISHLFPSTPGVVSRPKNVDHSKNSVSNKTVISETQSRQHQSFLESTPQARVHSHSQSQARIHSKARHSHTLPRSLAATSPTKVTSRRDTNIQGSHREASILRESTQQQGNVLDPRQGKRNTVVAGFNDTDSQARPSKMQKAELPKQTKALGPVIEDSQSPLLNGRSRKMTRRKSSAPKVDKFTRRFAQA